MTKTRSGLCGVLFAFALIGCADQDAAVKESKENRSPAQTDSAQQTTPKKSESMLAPTSHTEGKPTFEQTANPKRKGNGCPTKPC